MENQDIDISAQKVNANEPLFILRGSDPIAPALVELWAKLKEHSAGDNAIDWDEINKAEECARQMHEWQYAM